MTSTWILVIFMQGYGITTIPGWKTELDCNKAADYVSEHLPAATIYSTPPRVFCLEF